MLKLKLRKSSGGEMLRTTTTATTVPATTTNNKEKMNRLLSSQVRVARSNANCQAKLSSHNSHQVQPKIRAASQTSSRKKTTITSVVADCRKEIGKLCVRHAQNSYLIYNNGGHMTHSSSFATKQKSGRPTDNDENLENNVRKIRNAARKQQHFALAENDQKETNKNGECSQGTSSNESLGRNVFEHLAVRERDASYDKSNDSIDENELERFHVERETSARNCFSATLKNVERPISFDSETIRRRSEVIGVRERDAMNDAETTFEDDDDDKSCGRSVASPEAKRDFSFSETVEQKLRLVKLDLDRKRQRVRELREARSSGGPIRNNHDGNILASGLMDLEQGYHSNAR